MFRYEPVGNGSGHRNRFTGAICYVTNECWFEHEWDRLVREEQAKAAKSAPKTNQFGDVLDDGLPNDWVPVRPGPKTDRFGAERVDPRDWGAIPEKR